MRSRHSWLALTALVLVAVTGSWGCAAKWAYRQGLDEAKKGNWDMAVARMTRALQKDPDNIGYKIALDNARSRASRHHQEEAQKHVAADMLEWAADELEIAAKYDSSNKAASDQLEEIRAKILKREEEKRRLAEFEAKSRTGVRYPVPVLSPRSTAPIMMAFPDQSLEKIFQALGKVAGVNVVFDQDYRDKKITVSLMGLTFQEALDQLTFSNRLFYKVVDKNTLIIVPESVPKRRAYDDIFMRTFYLQNADVKDVEAVLKGVLGAQGKVASNPTLGAITVTGTVDQLALAEKVLETNDKARGEVVVEVQILEVNRNRLRDYGISLASYTGAVTLQPTGKEKEVEGGLLSTRAHLLSSLNLSDYVVTIPAGILAKLVETEGTARILATPKLRAAEGKKTALKIGTEVPVPVTTFTATQTTGGGTFSPATSFQYRNVGVNLEITPKVSAGGEINLEMAAEFSSQGAVIEVSGSKAPTFLTRNVNGQLRLRDGQTTLIGGLLQQSENEAIKGALGVQSIPILNKLFSTREHKNDDTEILISITPHLVRAPRVTEEDLQALYIGTMDNTKVPSARPPLFGEEPKSTPSPTPPPPSPAGPTAPSAPAAPPGAHPPQASSGPPATPGPPGLTQPSVKQPVTAALSPLETKVKVGDATSVSVVLMSAQDLTGVEVVLRFDPMLVEPVDVAAGSFLSLGAVPVSAERAMEPGRVRARFLRGAAVSGSGVVAALTVKGLKEGTTPVVVESLVITTPAGSEQVRAASPAQVVVQAVTTGGPE